MRWLLVAAGALSFWKAWKDCTSSAPLPLPLPAIALNSEQIMVINAFVENLAPPTVTVTVGVVATPVTFASATPSAISSAYPGAVASSRHNENSPDSTVLFTPLSYQNGIFAAADFFENGGFTVPGFRVTPQRFTVFWFMFGCLQLAYMIIYADFKLPAKAFKSLCHGFWSGGKVLWTLIIASAMFFTYDTLPEDPVALAALELLFLDNLSLDFVARYVRAKIIRWYDPLPDHPTGLWLMSELFGDVDRLQQNGQFKPKSLEELLVGVLVWLYRSASAQSSLMTTLPSALWSWTCPRIKLAGLALVNRLPTFQQIIAFGTMLWKWLETLLRWRYECIIVPICDLFFMIGYYSLQNILRGGLDDNMAGSYDYMRAIGTAATLTLDDIAKLIIGNKSLEEKMAKAIPEARRLAVLEAQHDTRLLGQRCRSWRTSHIEMAKDYNYCRRMLDITMTKFMLGMLGQNPNGEYPKFFTFFRHSGIIMTDEPGSNNLHYKANGHFKSGPCTRATKEYSTQQVLDARRSMGIRKKPASVVLPTMDLWEPQSWCFDLSILGLDFAPFPPESNPVDLSKRRAIPTWMNQMEDYAIAGKMDQWHAEEPTRKLERARIEAHPWTLD